jgi:hypothetical protein
LYAQPIEQEEIKETGQSNGHVHHHEHSIEAAGEKAGQYIRDKCDHCWYKESDVKSSAKKGVS